MTSISNNQLITIHRGDTLQFPLIINVSSKLSPRKYKLKPGESVYFGIMECNVPFEDALIRKKYTNADLDEHDCVIVKLDVNDTIKLLPGTYYYEVKFMKEIIEPVESGESGEGNTITKVRTIIGRRKFLIVE